MTEAPSPRQDPYRAVFQVGATVAGTLDLDEVLATVAQQVAEALGVQQCDIHHYDREADTLTCAAIWTKALSEEDLAWIGHVIQLDDRPARREVLETRAPVEAYADDEALAPEERAIMLEWHELATMEVPLLYGDEVIGVLGVCDTERLRRYTAEEIQLLQLLAGPAAIAIRNALLFRGRAERAKRLGAVVDASRAITSSLDLDEVLHRVAQQAVEVMHGSQSAIYEYRPETDAIVYRAVHERYVAPGSAEDDDLGTSYALDDYPTYRAILTAASIVEEHLSDQALPEDRRRTMAAWNEQTVVSVPLVFRGDPIGILRLYDMQEERHYEPAELDLLRSLGELAGAALNNARLYRQHTEHSRRLLSMLDVSRRLTSGFDVREVAEAVGDGARRLLDEDVDISVWVRDGGDRLVPAGLLPDEEAAEASLSEAPEVPALALEALGEARPARRVAAAGSSLVAPFVSRGRVEGFVQVAAAGFRVFGPAEVEALQVLANQAAVALANAALYRQVQRQAMRDGLTGLYNHRHFQERLAEECARAQRYRLPLALLMIDVDDFKRFNDEHGHQLGDEVLREVGRIMRASIRGGIDLPARYGGEEFAVVLPHTSATGAVCAGQRLKEQIEALDGEIPPPGQGCGDGGRTPARGGRGTELRGPRRSPLCAPDGEHRRRELRGRSCRSRMPRRAGRQGALRGQARRQEQGRGVRHVRMLQDRHAVLDMALELSAAVSSSLDLEEVLSTMARRLAEAFDVWECDFYEYRADDQALVARAFWSRECTERDTSWIGTTLPLTERASYGRLLLEGGVREIHLDDDLDEVDRREMDLWGEQSDLSVALFFGDEPIGVLTLVEKRWPRHFAPEERELLARLASPAAVAIHNARMFRREAEQNRRLRALVEASRAISSEIELDELLRTVARVAGEALGTDECAIDTYDPETETTTVVALYQRVPDDADEWIGKRFPLSDFPSDRHTLYGDEVVEEHVSDPTLDEANRRSMLENGEKTVLSVPLHDEGMPIGILAFFELGAERHFTRDEREIARALGEQAAVAIRNAHTVRRIEEQNRRLDSLLESTKAITSSVDLDEVLLTVARTAAAALDCQQCQIQEYDQVADTVTVAAMYTAKHDPLAYDSLHEAYSLEDEPEEKAIIKGRVPGRAVRVRPGPHAGGAGGLREIRRQGLPERAARVQRRGHRAARPHRDRAGAALHARGGRTRPGARRAGRRRHRARQAVPIEGAAGAHRWADWPVQPPLLLRAAGAGGGARPPLRDTGLAAHDRHRRLQGVQRLPRARGRRRRSAEGRGHPRGGVAEGRGHRGPLRRRGVRRDPAQHPDGGPAETQLAMPVAGGKRAQGDGAAGARQSRWRR